MDLSGLPTPVSARSAADLAHSMDEKPGSRNWDLPGVDPRRGNGFCPAYRLVSPMC